MREYKFRAWDGKNNNMVYSDNMNYAFNIRESGLCLQKNNTGEDISWSLYEIGLEFLDYKNIDDATFMQYTGLKDVSGKEIYEGDICELSSEEYYSNPYFSIDEDWRMICVVKFASYMYFF